MHPLWRIFYPQSIAVVGASTNPGKLGYAVVANIVRGGYRGRVIPVNPNANEILGLPCVADAADLPDGIDIAIVILPSSKVTNALRALAKRGVKGAIVPAAGFAETGPEGVAMQDEIRAICAESDMRVLGPNVPGFVNAAASLNATFAGGPIVDSPLAILSQAGSVAYLLARNLLPEHINFGRFICIGNQADLSESDILDYLAADPGVRVVCAYLESVRDGARFLEVAERVTRQKPMLAVKGGQTSAGHSAIFSHTASISSPERIYAAAFRRAGVIAVENLHALGTTAFALAHQPVARGPRVALVTSLAGVGVIASDVCEKAGLKVVQPSEMLRSALATLIPPTGSTRNPVDLTGDVSPAMLAACIRCLTESDEFDCILPLVMGVPGSEAFGNVAYAQAIVPELKHALAKGKVVCLQWVMDEANGAEIDEVRKLLEPVGIPLCLYPEDAVNMLAGLVQYGRIKARPAHRGFDGDKLHNASLFDVRRKGRTVLTEHVSKAILAAADIAVVPSRLADNAKAAVKIAQSIGYPVALKLQSPDATHKSDIGGVALNLRNDDAVSAAFERMVDAFRKHHPGGTLDGVSVQPMIRSNGVEMLCGVSEDEQFGKYLMVGLGGTTVEIMQDVSIRLLPVGEADVREMLEELKGYPLLTGARGRPKADIARLTQFIRAVTELAAAPDIVELEVNPIFATPEGAFAMDARARLRKDFAGAPHAAANVAAADRVS
jgi:acetate---CoA ligase (ADP-forming)